MPRMALTTKKGNVAQSVEQRSGNVAQLGRASGS